MAANYDIIVKAVDQTKATFSNIEKSLANINGLAAKVGGVIAGAFSVKQIIDTAVAYQGLEKRIIAVTGAGTASQKTMTELNALASQLGVSVEDLGLAFNNLKSVGLDSSAASLKTYAALAAATGSTVEQIADAMGNAYQGQFGKIGKATNDLIDVQEKYGQYVVKIAGVEKARVASTGEAVMMIKQYAAENQNYADALKQQSESISASFSRLGNATSQAFTASGLDRDIANFIKLFIDLENQNHAITDTFKYLGEALKFVNENFKLIGTAIAAIGLVALGGRLIAIAEAAYAITKSFNSWIGAVIDGKTALFGFATAAGKNMGYVEAAIKTVGNAWGFITRIFESTIGTFGGVIGSVVGVGLSLGVFGSTIVKLGGLLLRFMGGPWGLLIAGVLTFSDEILNAGRGLLEFFGILDKKKEFKVTTGTPTGAGYRTPGMGPQAVAGPGIDVATGVTPEAQGINPLTEYLKGLASALAQAGREASVLKPALNSALNRNDLSLASKLFSELTSRMEQFGQVAVKPTALIMRDFALETNKTTEELRQHDLQLYNTTVLSQKWNNELKTTQLQLDEQQMKLQDATYMSRKFIQELAQTNQTLQENALKLRDAGYQQDIFSQSLITARQGVQQQKITLELLNKTFADGSITLVEYTDALANINERLLGVAEKTSLLNVEYAKNQKNLGDSKTILEALTADYQSGAIGLEEYAKKLALVSYEYENLTSTTAKALKGGKDDVRTQDLSTQSAKNLTEQLRAGTITWREYNSAISKLDSTGVQRSFINIENEILRAKTLGEALADTLNESTKKAGDALAQNLTDGIMKGQLRLSSFKDFFGSILNDITAMLIKKQFVSPIVDALTGAMGSSGSAGGGLLSGILGSFGKSGGSSSGGGIFDSIISGAKDLFGGFFAGGGYLPDGKLGIAGEAGPELIAGPAMITPMDNMSGPTPVVNFTINAIDTQTGVEFLMKNKPQIVGMVNQGFNSQGRRGIYA